MKRRAPLRLAAPAASQSVKAVAAEVRDVAMPASRPTSTDPGRHQVRAFIWDILTFDKLMVGPVIHLIYWSGLALIVLIGFSIIGGAIGLGIRDGSIAGVGLAFATLVAGLVVLAALILIWRGMSEFYLAVFRIAEDLRVLRLAVQADQGNFADTATTPPARAAPIPGGVEL